MSRIGVNPLFEGGQVLGAGLFGIQFCQPFAGLGLGAFVLRKCQYRALVGLSIAVMTHGIFLVPGVLGSGKSVTVLPSGL